MTFDTQGGTQVLPVFVENDQSISGAGLNPTTNKAGYDFDGWLLNGAPYSLSTPVTGDITLTASWTPRTDTPYRVVYWFENAEDTGYSYATHYDTTGTTDTVTRPLLRQASGHYEYGLYQHTYNAMQARLTKPLRVMAQPL